MARHADAWHAAFPERPAELEPAVEALRRHCADIGRDPEAIEWAVGVEPDDLDRFLADDAATYLAMGFTQFTLGCNGPTAVGSHAAANELTTDDRQRAR